MSGKEMSSRVLGRLLAVEETEIVGGAVTAPGEDGQSGPEAEAGTGCIGADDQLEIAKVLD